MAKDVLQGRSRSLVRAAYLLARYVMAIEDESAVSTLPPSAFPPPEDPPPAPEDTAFWLRTEATTKFATETSDLPSTKPAKNDPEEDP